MKDDKTGLISVVMMALMMVVMMVAWVFGTD